MSVDTTLRNNNAPQSNRQDREMVRQMQCGLQQQTTSNQAKPGGGAVAPTPPQEALQASNDDLQQALHNFSALAPTDQVELSHRIEELMAEPCSPDGSSPADPSERRWQIAARATQEWASHKLEGYYAGQEVNGGVEGARNLVQLQHYASLFQQDRQSYLKADCLAGQASPVGSSGPEAQAPVAPLDVVA